MKRFILFNIVLTLLVVTAFAAPITKKVILRVDLPETVWHDPEIDLMLKQELASFEQIFIADDKQNDKNAPVFPKDNYNTEALIGWGQEIGGGYLVYVKVESERLERRNTFSLPLIFKKYETVGVIEGRMSICDLQGGRVLMTEKFKTERKGPKILQASMNDTPDDPDLHLTSIEKIKFFKELERETSVLLSEKSKSYLGIRR